MNSFETDLKRALCSVNFAVGFLLECAILWQGGVESDLFQMSVPVLASVPYSTAWIREYEHGFIKEYLPRCGRTSYIMGKFLACGISGGSCSPPPCLCARDLERGRMRRVTLFSFSSLVCSGPSCQRRSRPRQIAHMWRMVARLSSIICSLSYMSDTFRRCTACIPSSGMRPSIRGYLVISASC